MTQCESQGSVRYDRKTEEVVIKRRVNSIGKPFSIISVTSNKKRRNMVKDIFDLLDEVSKGAFSVFNQLKYNRDEDNNTIYYPIPDGLTKSQTETRYRNIRELKKVGLIGSMKVEAAGFIPNTVYKFKKHTYIINPDMLRCWKYDEAMHLWSNRKGERCEAG